MIHLMMRHNPLPRTLCRVGRAPKRRFGASKSTVLRLFAAVSSGFAAEIGRGAATEFSQENLEPAQLPKLALHNLQEAAAATMAW
jgi:hypothetical protein